MPRAAGAGGRQGPDGTPAARVSGWASRGLRILRTAGARHHAGAGFAGTLTWAKPMALACLALTAVFGPARAENEASALLADTLEQADDQTIGFGMGSVIVAPIPLKSPALGSGLIMTGGYLFKLDAGSDTSFFGAAALRTNNGSEGAALAANLSFDHDRWSLLTMFGKARVNYSIYNISGRQLGALPVSQEGTFVRIGVDRGLSDALSIGVDVQYLDTTINTNGSASAPLPNLPGFGIGVRQALVGPRFTFDTRDDTIYPTRGVFSSLQIQRGMGLGTFDNRFTRGTLVTNAYMAMSERSVLAFGSTVCRASEGAPFFNLCSVGTTDSLRGFPAGQYYGNALMSVQAEFRHRLGDRWGVSAFAGASSVGPEFSDLDTAVGAAGIGLRFRLSRSLPLDFSVDQTRNSAGDSFTYVYIGQAF